MISGAVILPHPPLLLPGATGGPVIEVEELRRNCLEALRDLVSHVPDRLIVIGGDRPGESVRQWHTDAALPCTRFAPQLGIAPTVGLDADSKSLPLSLGVGVSLLEQAGIAIRNIEMCSVPTDLPVEECVNLGARMVAGAERVALVVLGDGSARRRPSSPGYVDDRAIGFDENIEKAFAAADVEVVQAIDPLLSAELLVAGRAAWQVLAGALAGLPVGEAAAGANPEKPRVSSQIRYSADPFGVWYLVASLTVAQG